jgi:hypothetical protein
MEAPLVKEVKPHWHTVRFNGTFLRENVYWQDAGPEVDAAWEALGINCKFCEPGDDSVANGRVETGVSWYRQRKQRKLGYGTITSRWHGCMEVDIPQTSKDCTICIVWYDSFIPHVPILTAPRTSCA